MGETKAKYHHLIPRTYLSAWKHGNGTLYIRFLENKESVVERNKDNIAGITNYHSIVAGMPIVTKEDADKTYFAVKDWLWKRLKLEVSDEKSKVTNLRKRSSEFLGFQIKLRRKRNSWVITSNVCDKR